MSEDESPDDKPFEASEKKLLDARKKGELVKSTDLIATGSYGGLILGLVFAGAGTLTISAATMQGLLREADTLAPELFAGGASSISLTLILGTVGALSLWFFLPMLGAIASLVLQRALVFAPTKLEPKLNRISILSNAKNKFGREGLFEFLKSTFKLVVFSILLGLLFMYELDTMISLAAQPVSAIIGFVFYLLIEFLALVFLATLLIGGVDYIWQRAQHLRKNRMSRQEVVDETKSAEGDPHSKQYRRQRAIEIATQQMLADVPDASVVVVNPTHYAVALKWDRFSPTAPIVVASGVDHVAAAIRQRAQEAGVPIHRDPPTARALYATCKLGQEIPRAQFKAVAAAIRFAEAMRAKARKKPL
ncbi:flagellar biosynthesis protein FlhB [Dinoroseobacter shibae DFL 12 = DSM 16493]|jgi:flagellar biosynthetic protein FlhB|uniref:Flagellar biosynthesis protein FlhB n=1 Tax=Dinoroseobacter shibae (strain DSM 16493 / NCIMB 14021 / DFL 12) TaxID=398580 RepID=A8LMR4_DINSH|nr:flagellar type III secretion system protein FlhB [Dinoroseobacter shibae]ABV94989.1 flagellar biosynthesis protein FlhB [Dinoroseobacter shibae DFL 12 = DSM 16493]URF46409.1 flagellar type III secretion system protein FlhB [Dinoroseobacter shibae]URF50715.1 flagellar type III secretion system protein FlhB [Dinoroseobacter shibae]